MLSENISNQILTVGCEYCHPKGGIAQVIYNYEQYVFPKFKCIVNSGGTNKVKKWIKAISGWLEMGFQLLIDKRIKIVHIHTASYNSFKRSAWFVRVAKWMNKKVVIHIHGGGFKEYYAQNQNFVSSVLEKCDAIITLSTSWKEFFENIVGHKSVFIVPNIIEPPTLRTVSKDGLFHLLYLGHISKAKGIFDLVEMIRLFQIEYRNRLVLDIGGGKFEVDKLVNIIRQNQLEDVIHFHGWVSGEKKYELLNLANAFILPSYTEGVPISILEAESYSLPVLSTMVGGIPEIVIDGKNGFLFEPGSKVKMKQAIDNLLNNVSQQKVLGAMSKQISMKYHPEEVAICLNKVYENI